MTRWKKTLYATWIAQALSITGFFFIMPFIPYYIQYLGVEDKGEAAKWAGMAAAASGIAMVFFAPIWGALADKYGRKPMVLRAMLGGALVMGLLALAQNVWHLVLLRALQGMLTGTVGATITLAASVAPNNRHGYTFGMLEAAVFIGSAIGPFLGGMTVDYLGYREACLIGAGILVIATLLVKFVAHEEFTPQPPASDGRRNGFAKVFAATGFIAALVVLFQFRFADQSHVPVFPLFVKELWGTEQHAATVTGTILAVASIAAAAGAWLCGHLTDVWGRKKVLAASALLAGLISIPIAFVQDIAQLSALRILLQLFAAGILPSANAIILRITHNYHIGKAYGITYATLCLGAGLGPLAGGYLADRIDLRAPFVLAGVILVLAAFTAMWRLKDGKNVNTDG